jgi:hypothetical protein
MFKEFIYNFIRFANGLLSVGIEKQNSHVSEVVLNTSRNTLLSLYGQVFCDHVIDKNHSAIIKWF